jgi:hypothetical protein
VKLEIKIWFGVDEDATNVEGWMVCGDRKDKDIGNFDIVFPKTITLTIPEGGSDG